MRKEDRRRPLARLSQVRVCVLLTTAGKGEGRSLAELYLSDEVDDMECPLCLEEIDISDANFKPCPCGYQICRFCWHHIKQNLNGRCPACRRKYSDQAIEFKAMSTEECVPSLTTESCG